MTPLNDVDPNRSCLYAKSHLVLQHVHIVIRGLWPLLSHFLQVTQQVWHIHPELLRVTCRWCGVAAGWKYFTFK